MSSRSARLAPWWSPILLFGALSMPGTAAASFTFKAPSSHEVDARSIDVALADVDGDGDLDVVVSGFGSAVSVSLNQGDGSFAPRASYPSGGAVQTIVADLDADGLLDLATIDYLGARLLLRSNVGSGGFGAPQILATGTGPRAIAIGDWNGDGVPELAVAHFDESTVRIYSKSGPGLAYTSGPPIPVGAAPKSVVMADLDADGRDDIVTANDGGGGVTILYSRTANPERVDLGMAAHPSAVIAADLDANGTIDLATSSEGRVATVRLNTGGGVFGSPAHYAIGYLSQSLAAADFNHDGYRDLAVSNFNEGTLSILGNRGDGTFETAQNFPCGTGLRGVAVGDLDGDSVVDAVVANDAPGRFTWIGNSTLGPVISSFAPSFGSGGTVVTIHGARLSGTNRVRFGALDASFEVISNIEVRATAPDGVRTGPLTVDTHEGDIVSVAAFYAPPAITSFTPNHGVPGNTVLVNGQNFSGTSQVVIGGRPGPFVLVTDELVRATVPAGATTGPVSLTAPGGTAHSSEALGIVAVHSFHPVTGGAGTVVTIHGEWLGGTTEVRFGAAVAGLGAVSASEVVVTVPAHARTGPIEVVAPAGVVRSPGAFQAPPVITSFSPRRALLGTPMGIRGFNLTGATAVTIGGGAVPFTVEADTLVRTTVTSEAADGPVAITAPAGTAVSDSAFHLVLPGSGGPPGINLSWDDCGTMGVAQKSFTCALSGPTYHMVGSFVPPPEVTAFAGMTADLTVTSAYGGLPAWWRHGLNQCRGTSGLVPSTDFSAGPYGCLDPYSLGSSAVLTYDINYGGPGKARIRVTSTVPEGLEGPLNPGTEYHAFRLGVTRETITSTGCSGCEIVVTIDLNSIEIHQPAAMGFDPLLTTVRERARIHGGAPPVITSFEPAIGAAGSLVTIRGRKFYDAHSVQFGGTAATFQTITDAEIHATVPEGAFAGAIRVANLAASASTTSDFVVIAQPVIASFTPDHGPEGYPVHVRGTGFTGTTAVRFHDGVTATFTVLSDSLLRAVVPGTAITGPITVVNPFGSAASASSFVVDPPGLIGVNLAWDDCGAAGSSVKGFACESNHGTPFTLVGSFVPPAGVEEFHGIAADLVVRTEGGSLPDWWKHGPGSCRDASGLSANFDFSSGPATCVDFFRGRAVGGHSYTILGDTPDRARLHVQCAVAFGDRGPLLAETEYYAFKVLVQRPNTAGDEACAGCADPVAIELERVQLFQPSDSDFDPILETTLNGNVVQWQGAADPTPSIHSFAPLIGGKGTVVTIVGENLAGTNRVRFGTRTANFSVVSESVVEAVAPPSVMTSRIVLETPHGSAGSDSAFQAPDSPGYVPGINLAWNDCGYAGSEVQDPDCAAGEGAPFSLYASFVPPQDIVEFVGLDAQIDVRSAGHGVPDWWKHGAGLCRGTSGLSVSSDFTTGPYSCDDPWLGHGTGGLDYQVGFAGPDRARLRVLLAIPADLARPLDHRNEYYAFRVNLVRSRPGESCPGCETPVCIVLDHVQLHQTSTLGFDPMITQPLDRNYVSWSTPGGGCADVATPVLAAIAGVDARPDRVRVEWTVEGFTSAAIYRREGAAPWRRLGVAIADGSHRIAWDDVAVTPGARYGYRLGLGAPGGEVFAGETEVTVPVAVAEVALGIAGARFSASGGLVVELSLATAAPAALEVYDVNGRRWARQPITGLGRGTHEVRVPAALRPGVFFARLVQERETANRRFVVIP